MITLLFALAYSATGKKITLKLTPYKNAECTTADADKVTLVSPEIPDFSTVTEVKIECVENNKLQFKKKDGTDLFKVESGKKTGDNYACIKSKTEPIDTTHFLIEWTGDCGGNANPALTAADVNTTKEYFLKQLEQEQLPTQSITFNLTPYADAQCTGTATTTLQKVVSGPLPLGSSTTDPKIVCDNDQKLTVTLNGENTALVDAKKNGEACIQLKDTHAKIQWAGECGGDKYGTYDPATAPVKADFLKYLSKTNAFPNVTVPVTQTIKLTTQNWASSAKCEGDADTGATEKQDTQIGDSKAYKCVEGDKLQSTSDAAKKFENGKCFKDGDKSIKLTWTGACMATNEKVKLTKTVWAASTKCEGTSTKPVSDQDTPIGEGKEYKCYDGDQLQQGDIKYRNGKCNEMPGATTSMMLEWTGDCTKSDGDSKKKLSGGAIAAIVIGSLAGVALLSFLVYWFAMRK